MLCLFAQGGEVAATSSAVAGWTTFGLAGLILAWLFFKHLPDKDKQIRELLTAHQGVIRDKDAQIDRMLVTKNMQIEILTRTGTEQVKAMVESHSYQLKTTMETNAANVRTMHDENQRGLERIIRHCEEEMRSYNEIRKVMEEATQHDLRELSVSIDELTVTIRDLQQNQWMSRGRRQGESPVKPFIPEPKKGS